MKAWTSLDVSQTKLDTVTPWTNNSHTNGSQCQGHELQKPVSVQLAALSFLRLLVAEQDQNTGAHMAESTISMFTHCITAV